MDVGRIGKKCNGHHFSHAPRLKFINISPSEIRYSRHSVSRRLITGIDVVHLLRRLLCKDIGVEYLTYENLEPIKVIKLFGYYYVKDGHKRLWVLKELEKLGICNKIWVHVVARRNFYSYSTCELSEGKEIEFLWKDGEVGKLNFEREVYDTINEFSTTPPQLKFKPSSTKFLWENPRSTGTILGQMVERHAWADGMFPWYNGPYNFTNKFIRLCVLFLFVCSLIGFGQKSFYKWYDPSKGEIKDS